MSIITNTPAINLTRAIEFPLLEIINNVPPNSNIGKMYATNPNNPKKKELMAAPTIPPTPKLAIKNITESANAISTDASLAIPVSLRTFFFGCGTCLYVFFLLFVLFFL